MVLGSQPRCAGEGDGGVEIALEAAGVRGGDSAGTSQCSALGFFSY